MDSHISAEGLRVDGRRFNELRQIKCKMGVVQNADGSAYFKQGHTEVIATVFGPREIQQKSKALSDRLIINCDYKMAAFSTGERKNKTQGTRRSTEISMVIKQTFEAVVLCSLSPRSQVDISITVIQADGGTRCAAINAVTLALIDAGIPMKEFVVSCASGYIDGTAILDLNYIEDAHGNADLPIAMLPQSGKITMLQMDSKLKLKEFEVVLNLAISGCKKIHEILVAYVAEYTRSLINSRGLFSH